MFCLSNTCPRLEPWVKYLATDPIDDKSIGEDLDDRVRLYHDESYSYWRDRVARRSCPEVYVETTTPAKNWNTPFHKDTSFTCPVGGRDFCDGNEAPMRQIRDVKRI